MDNLLENIDLSGLKEEAYSKLKSALAGQVGSPLSGLGWFVVGAAVGGAAMWLLDPEKGMQRRSQLRDQALKFTGDFQQRAEQEFQKFSGQVSDAWPSGDQAAKRDPQNLDS